MTVERNGLPPRPDSAGSVRSIPNGLGEDDREDGMTSFFHTQFESILKPFAANVEELYQTVLNLSSEVQGLQTKTESNMSILQQHAARLDDMQGKQEGVIQQLEATYKMLQSSMDSSEKTEKERSLRIEKLDGALALIQSAIEELQKNSKDTSTKLLVLQDSQDKHGLGSTQLESELGRVAKSLEETDKAHATIIETMNTNRLLLDTTIMEKEKLEQAQKESCNKFDIFSKHCADKFEMVDTKYSEIKRQALQYHEEGQKVIDAAKFDKQKILDKQSAINKEISEVSKKLDDELEKHNTRIENHTTKTDELLMTQGQQQQEHMNDVRRNLESFQAIASKHEKEFAAFQTVTEVLPGRVKKLEQEADFSSKRSLRLEKFLGLEPMDSKRGVKKRASTAMLGEDQLLRKAWTAWIEAMHEAKQSRTANAIPNMQEMLKMHSKVIESEKSKLHSTNDRVQSLEMDHTKLEQELRNLRRSRDLNEGHWKGMARGLQVANKTMHTELKELPRLPGSRPVSSMS
eukprot:gnl/MRDRNA2_/MRDRNA2_83403_c0_seq6.p1 gnl/MRDRNA2_/MRDRNA2_83403_c0~~gnl/MRDRNA2_/MRDRNA2_83403_c0_seq6.p1  ORF type:complete len:518 (-),score=129.20 gnl/MRDRNA2_/MRDRNA2_83403_c0_seq6:134-1687(-)